jgi:hypothetical protein
MERNLANALDALTTFNRISHNAKLTKRDEIPLVGKRTHLTALVSKLQIEISKRLQA